MVAVFIYGVEIVYKVVMKFVEGIILIVFCEVVCFGECKVKEIDDCIEVMIVVVVGVKCVLVKIFDLLFVLKEVGVVDSGG